MIRMRPVILGWDEMGELVRKRKIRKEPHHEVQLTHWLENLDTIWLVVWNIVYFPYIGNNNPN
jgi:hypothetical protein